MQFPAPQFIFPMCYLPSHLFVKLDVKFVLLISLANPVWKHKSRQFMKIQSHLIAIIVIAAFHVKIRQHYFTKMKSHWLICKICSAEFPSKYMLNGHTKSHGDKPLKCDEPYCNFAYTYKSELWKHMKNKKHISTVWK